MGRSPRPRPKRLAAKLAEVRNRLGLTQTKMAERLEESGETVYPGMVSEFESDDREPTLLVLLQYSRIAGVTINTFADDDEDLPDRLPAELNEWVMIRRDSDSTK